jgi:hypothetical protein
LGGVSGLLGRLQHDEEVRLLGRALPAAAGQKKKS